MKVKRKDGENRLSPVTVSIHSVCQGDDFISVGRKAEHCVHDNKCKRLIRRVQSVLFLGSVLCAAELIRTACSPSLHRMSSK